MEWLKQFIKEFKKKRHPLYKEYKSRVIDKRDTCDYERGAGYYLPELSFFCADIMEAHSHDVLPTASGRKGVFKLIQYDTFSDPPDMVKWSKWQFLGYVNRKPVAKMTFEEYIDLQEWYE
jgi:hypothetical protein